MKAIVLRRIMCVVSNIEYRICTSVWHLCFMPVDNKQINSQQSLFIFLTLKPCREKRILNFTDCSASIFNMRENQK